MRVIDFHPEVFVAVSERSDGNMKNPRRIDWIDEKVVINRESFLQRSKISTKETALIAVDYSRDNFTKYYYINASGKFTVDHERSTIPSSDGLATMTSRLGIILPLADCLGVVLFDLEKKLLMTVHAGRHNLEQNGLAEAIKFMTKYGSDPNRIQVWLSPSAGAKNYPLHKFNSKSLKQVAREQLKDAGVKDVTSDEVDTTVDENYFSHSQGDREKRHAILAYIK